MSVAGRSLELFFIDGRADGMLTAEVFNWTGHVLRAPRIQLKQALLRDEASNTGVYFLMGQIDGHNTLYIGEAEDMRERLRSHAQTKDWWDEVVLITTAADALHKAHVKYLESRLVEIARDVSAVSLENGNTPSRSSLSEAATANMESFIDTLMMVLPAIRIDAFLSKKRSKADANSSAIAASLVTEDTPQFIFEVKRHRVQASAILRNGEWVVLAGSTVRGDWVGDRKHNTHYHKLHDELISQNVIGCDGDTCSMKVDFAFSSPSAAAAVVAGRSANGRTSWIHTQTGQTYAEWEATQIEKDTE